MKKILLILLTVVFSISIIIFGVGCKEETAVETTAAAVETTAAAVETTAAAEETTASTTEPKEVAVIIKATDAPYWQYVLIGALNYAFENSDKVHVTTYGPATEAEIDKQVTILEDVIASKPDAIVIASTSSDATVPAIEKAVDAGIPVVTVDNKVNTEKVATFLATDNINGGALAADMLIETIQAAGKPLEGKVGIVSNMAGVQVLIDRDKGFIDRMAEIAPNIELMDVRYSDADIIKGVGIFEDLLTANKDLIGLYADNGYMSVSLATVMTERNLGGKIFAVSYDSFPEAVQAVKDGLIYALVVQNPYMMGYMGVDNALKSLAGEKLPSYVDTGVAVVTKENVDSPEIQGVLDPNTLKKY